MKSVFVSLIAVAGCGFALGVKEGVVRNTKKQTVTYTVSAGGSVSAGDTTVKEDCPSFGFDLETLLLTEAEKASFEVPADECFYPVTVQSLIDADHLEYSWVPHTAQMWPSTPIGAFVYKMGNGSLVYKKLVTNNVNPMLKFSCAISLKPLTNFADAENLDTASKCRKAPISISAPPFDEYTEFTWAQLSWMSCGAFIYRVRDSGALVYHTCDPEPHPQPLDNLTARVVSHSDDCPDFGFDLVDLELTDEERNQFQRPEPECFYPVTLQSLIDTEHVSYTWIPQTMTGDKAPSGAFVYAMQDGSFKYKNIIPKPTSENPMLKFSCALGMQQLTNFEDAENLGTASKCRQGPVSIPVAPFVAYQNYTWAQLSGMVCGAFFYKTHDFGPLLYHTCDPAPHPPSTMYFAETSQKSSAQGVGLSAALMVAIAAFA